MTPRNYFPKLTNILEQRSQSVVLYLIRKAKNTHIPSEVVQIKSTGQLNIASGACGESIGGY